jgi:hypothetical protein
MASVKAAVLVVVVAGTQIPSGSVSTLKLLPGLLLRPSAIARVTRSIAQSGVRFVVLCPRM